jgi:hypothetical protein
MILCQWSSEHLDRFTADSDGTQRIRTTSSSSISITALIAFRIACTTGNLHVAYHLLHSPILTDAFLPFPVPHSRTHRITFVEGNKVRSPPTPGWFGQCSEI